jgi:hypothetical protein
VQKENVLNADAITTLSDEMIKLRHELDEIKKK